LCYYKNIECYMWNMIDHAANGYKVVVIGLHNPCKVQSSPLQCLAVTVFHAKSLLSYSVWKAAKILLGFLVEAYLEASATGLCTTESTKCKYHNAAM